MPTIELDFPNGKKFPGNGTKNLFHPYTTCYYGCEILLASVPSRASSNKTVRTRVSNSGNLFHLVKHHLISRHLYKKTMNMNKTMVFAILITNCIKYEEVGVKTDN